MARLAQDLPSIKVECEKINLTLSVKFTGVNDEFHRGRLNSFIKSAHEKHKEIKVTELTEAIDGKFVTFKISGDAVLLQAFLKDINYQPALQAEEELGELARAMNKKLGLEDDNPWYSYTK